jgi:hypothetical protein
MLVLIARLAGKDRGTDGETTRIYTKIFFIFLHY